MHKRKTAHRGPAAGATATLKGQQPGAAVHTTHTRAQRSPVGPTSSSGWWCCSAVSSRKVVRAESAVGMMMSENWAVGGMARAGMVDDHSAHLCSHRDSTMLCHVRQGGVHRVGARTNGDE